MKKLLIAFLVILVGLYIYGFSTGAAISPVEIIFFLTLAFFGFRYYQKTKQTD